MTQKQLDALSMRILGFTFLEIGRQLGISAPAALYLVRRAKKNMKEHIKEFGHKKVTITLYMQH